MDEIIESTVNAEQVEVVTPQNTEVVETSSEQAETTQDVSEEVVKPQVEEKPVQSKEDNAKFAEMRRKAESEAIDKFIASQGYEFDGKPIKTKAEYDEAIRVNQERQRIQELVNNNVPEDVAKELVEAKRFRQEYEAEKQTKAQKEAQERDFQNFLESYPSVKADEIPVEVWAEVDKGKSLVDAYAKHENSILKAKLAEYEKGSKTQQINASNAESSTGSVTGNGQPVTKEITAESIATMSEKEISANWNQVKKILGMR
jgi:hypothetical protein